ncbi:MAG: diguanylate cyclase, partial [Litoreibacter sp.]
MQEEFLFGLLAPAIALLISMNFFVFWSRQPEARHILAFGMSFSLGAISMSLSHNLIAGLSYANVFTAILFDTASLSLLLWGSCERVKMKTPYFLIATTFAIALLAGYGMTKHLDVAALRLIPVNSLHATLLFTCGWVWRKGRDSEHVANRGAVSVIFFSFALFSIAFPFVMYNVPGTPLADQYQHSTSWFIYNFAIIMMVMIGGLTLTAVLADDMVKKIKIVSNTDLLTGLKTRRAFEEEFEDIFIKLERSPLPLSIIIADIDHFKLVNDTYGHQ